MAGLVEFVSRLDRWRQAIGMTQNEFAQEVLGVDKTSWSQIRRGVWAANPKFVGRIVLRYPWMARFIRGRDDPADAALP